jgi:DNA-directed RNA polymerase subunit RPC12/RpoP
MVTFLEAQNLQADYVCSRCWGHLVTRFVNGGAVVTCAVCGENTPGFVTKQYAERRKQESAAEKAEAQHVLKDIIPSSSSGKSKDDLLKELGF